MEKAYDRHNKYIGYLEGYGVYDKRSKIIGYIQDNKLLDLNYNPVSFVNNNVIYTMDGRPWAFFDGRVVRDMSRRRLGSAEYSWAGLLSTALIVGQSKILRSVRTTHTHNERDMSRREGDICSRESEYNEAQDAENVYRIGKYKIDRTYVKNAYYLGKSVFNATGGMSGPVGRYILGKSTGIGLSLLSKLLAK